MFCVHFVYMIKNLYKEKNKKLIGTVDVYLRLVIGLLAGWCLKRQKQNIIDSC